MRETFVHPPSTLNSNDEVPNLEDQSTVVFLAPPNLLQDSEQKQDDKDVMEENEELTSSCENSEPPLHNAPDTSIEDTGNDHGAIFMDGGNRHNMLNFSTHHAIKEKLLVEPSIDLSLSDDDLLDVPCDKDELFDNASMLHANAENKHVMRITSKNDELKLVSSFHTLGYIEFGDLCNLYCFEERLSQYDDLHSFAKHTFHVIGKYDNKEQYLIHRVYIRDNMNSHFVLEHCDQLEDTRHKNIFACSSSGYVLKKKVHSREGKNLCLLPSIPALLFVGTNLLQDGVVVQRVPFDQEACMLAEFFIQNDTLENWKQGFVPLHNYFSSICFRNPIFLCAL
jgi:hypothetical protein